MTTETEANSPIRSSAVADAAVDPGAFPFRITEGGESRYLKWIRDHADYMAVRGWSDYFRAAGVLVRGMFVNFLIVLPVLLATALAVASIRVWAFDLPFALTSVLVGVTVLLFASYPARTFVAKIAGYKRNQDRGTDSTVKQRDVAERKVGFLLVAIAAVAAFEALPVVLDPFHAWVTKYQFGWERLGSVVGIGTAVLSAADKVLSKLPRAAGTLAKAALGAIGILVPLLVVLSVADLLCFDPPPANWDFATTFAIWCLPSLLLVGLIVGSVRSAFSLKGVLVMSLLLIGSSALAYGAVEMQERLSIKAREEFAAFDEKNFVSEFPTLKPGTAAILVKQAGPSLRRLQGEIKEVPDREVKLQARHTEIPERPRCGEPRRPIDAQPETCFDCKTRLHEDLVRLREKDLPQDLRDHLETFLVTIQKQTENISDQDLGAIRRELGEIEFKLDILHRVFTPQAPGDLLQSVGRLCIDEIQALGQDGPMTGIRDRFPTLDSLASEELSSLLARVVRLAPDLRNARWEINESVHAASGLSSSADFIIEMQSAAFPAKALLVFVIALLLWVFSWLTVDVNLTSIHGLYRDRLASAFLVGSDSEGDVDIEGDIDLGDLCCHEAGSSAPYHLINVALNLQGSSDIGLRDRRCDFFIFSKKFTGGRRTGYCRSESMERVFPQMSLGSAMAISAAAASPNMGRSTSPALVALMTLLNIRLGIWVPNPGLLQERLDASKSKSRARTRADNKPPGFSFETVFTEELGEVKARWRNLPGEAERRLGEGTRPTVKHGLVGLAFSGGGIRSAAVNLGIVQMLEHSGAFAHVDYMSTVSGGGYLGSSISALMRRKTPTESEFAGRVGVRNDEGGNIIVSISSAQTDTTIRHEYRYSKDAKLAVKHDQSVKAGQRLIRTETDLPSEDEGFWKKYWTRRSFGEQFSWQVPSRALLWEMMGWLDEKKRWVNLSDGGHIENLGAIELLRRHCKYIVIGDGEADPQHRFNGLATLIRTARLDLGVNIDIDTNALRLREALCDKHWVGGRIIYPNEDECGYLLYLKSSTTGDEDEVIREYRHGNPSFPHESTADQMFNEAQFEAYRSLGQHIAEQPLYRAQEPDSRAERRTMSFAELGQLFETLCPGRPGRKASDGDASVRSPSV